MRNYKTSTFFQFLFRMGKNVAKGKIANKLASKKNKKHLKGSNQQALAKAKPIGAKNATKNIPTAKQNAQKKSQIAAKQAKVSFKLVFDNK